MKIAENVEMLETNSPFGKVYLTLTWDKNSLCLVDAGFPGEIEGVVQAIDSAGFSAKNITHIILTHQDIDHIGCVRDLLKLAPNAQVLAYKEEAPYINGKKTPIKLAVLLENYDSLPAEQKAFCDMLKQGFPNLTVQISHTLSDGDIIPICGGIEVIHTPGHTPGHMTLFLRESAVLVTGDALNVIDGKLTGPDPVYTYDMELGLRSVEKAKKFPIKAVVSYHGGYLEIG